jgi:hypothetical protein
VVVGHDERPVAEPPVQQQRVRGPRAGEAVRGARQRDRGAQRSRRAVEGGLELGAAAGRLRVGHPRHGGRALDRRDGLAAQTRGEAVAVGRVGIGAVAIRGAAHDQRRDGGRPRPARHAREVVDLLGADVVAREQPRERAPAALALALRRGALLSVALDAVGADAVDVAEDRAGQAVQRRRLVAGRLTGRHEALPRQPRAEPVGAQQRVEAAPAAELGAAELDVQRPRIRVLARRVPDAVHEARERGAHAGAQRAAERALDRLGVRGHLRPDRRDDRVGQVRQRRAQRRGE